MSEPFIAEIRIFAGNFAPRGWAFCNGQLLPIAQNTALFAIVGTTYGGDGRTTLGLPDLRGRAPMHPGRGPGLTSRRLGERGGVENVTLNLSQLPNHNHRIQATNALATTGAPNNATLANTNGTLRYGDPTDPESLASEVIASAGGNQAHENMQPWLALNFIIALQGLFPSRN